MLYVFAFGKNHLYFCHMMLWPVPSCSVCSVRPSVVLLSVTFMCCIKMSNHILKPCSWSDSHTILVFSYQSYGSILMGTPSEGVECRLGVKNRFFSKILTSTLLHHILSMV